MEHAPWTPAQLAAARRAPIGVGDAHGLRVEVLRDRRYGDRFVVAAWRGDAVAPDWQTVVVAAYLSPWSASVRALGDDLEVVIDGENERGAEPDRATFVLSVTGEPLARR